MLISVFASIWSQNLGDELILKNEIQILREEYKSNKPRFIVFTYDLNNIFYESEDIEYKEYFPIWIKNPKNIFKNINNFFIFLSVVFKSNLIVIGWGWLFFDNESWESKNPLNLWLFRKRIFNFFMKKIYFFRVWLSIKKEESFLKILKIFSWKNTKINVRDKYSKKVLEDLWLKYIEKKYDPVFYDKNPLTPLSGGRECFSSTDKGNCGVFNKKVSIKKIFKNFWIKDLEGIDFKDKKIWIAFRSWYLTDNPNPELEILLIKEIIEFMQKKWARVTLLAHSFHKNDVLSNDYDWMKLIQLKTKNVWISHSMKDTYSYYTDKKVDIVLAQRLHSIVLSQVYEIPFIWISYSRKTNEILNELK